MLWINKDSSVGSPRRASLSRAFSGALLTLLLSAVVSACGPEPEPLTPPPPAPPEAPVSAKRAPAAPLAVALDPAAAARFTADVGFLASPELAGRGTGDPGARAAADYIAKRFAELKLAPLGDRDDKGQPGYLQRFQARVGATAEPPSLSIEQGKPAKKMAVEAASMITADGSASETATGEVVFVGYGISATALGWNDYEGAVDVTGKIVVILSGAPDVTLEEAAPKAPRPDAKAPHADVKAPPAEPKAPHANAKAPPADPKPPQGDAKSPHAGPRPNALRDFDRARYKIRTAREHKAAGVILVAKGDELPSAPTDASSMGIPAVVIKRSAAKSLFPAFRLDDKKTWEAKKHARPVAHPKVSVALTTKVTPVMADAWNVVATLPAREGSKVGSEWVVIGAHYDHLGHGGNANSRAPGQIAIHPGADDNASGTALVLEVARQFAAFPSRPARNVAFITFSAEEVGVIGSRHWVEHAPIDAKSITAMINADMVGRLREGKLLVDGSATAAAWPDLAKKAAEGLDFNLAFGSEGYGASDHSSFTAARVPVAFLFSGTHEDYHKPSDTPDKINAEGGAKIATLAGRMLLAVAERDERMAFVDAPADPQKNGMRGGFRVSMGTVPDYAYAGKGMKLTGVRPDAPAARAGLQAGDVIVKVGTHEITNVHDFMFSLGDLEPGREVIVEIERGGARLPIKVIPAPSNR